VPLYEYRCDACGQRFEVIQKFSDPAPAACRLCGKGPVERQHSSPAIQFKGSGFYITDYARKGQSDSSSSGSSSKSDGGKTEGTTEGKTDAAAKTDTAKSESGKSETTKSDTAKSDTPAAKSKD
jgi:putative FmdB family regulatory protein